MKSATEVESEVSSHDVESIGQVAGWVWSFLRTSGPVTLSKLAREIKVPRDMVMQGVGWLAREEKIVFLPGENNKLISLR